MSEKLRFFTSFLRSPRAIGSVVPSSVFLTNKMIKPVDWKKIDTVVELGAGTGVFTQQIDHLLPRDRTGFIFEQDDSMRKDLMRRYPRFAYHKDALNMKEVIRHHVGRVDVILSGLPFANFPQPMREQLIQAIDQILHPEGVFIAFQYSLQMKKMLQSHFPKVAFSFVPLNIPPAVVYCCRKM